MVPLENVDWKDAKQALLLSYKDEGKVVEN